MEKMTINGEQWVRLSDMADINELEWQIGESYHIETTTKYFTGVLVGLDDECFFLSNACWIASTGYFNDYACGGKPDYSEPYAPESILIVSRASFVSAIKREIITEKIR